MMWIVTIWSHMGYWDIWIFGYLDIHKYTCMNTHQPFAAVSQVPAALRRFLKHDPLDFLSMYAVDLVDFH